MKIKIEGHIYGWHFGDPKRVMDDFDFGPGKGTDGDSNIVVAPHTIEVEVELPGAEQITASIVQALRKEKQKAYEVAAQKAAVYDDRINKLLALTNEVPAAVTEISDDLPF